MVVEESLDLEVAVEPLAFEPAETRFLPFEAQQAVQVMDFRKEMT